MTDTPSAAAPSDSVLSRLDPRAIARMAPVAILLAEIAFFGILRFDTFFTANNWHVIVNNTALLGIVAGGLTIALIVGDFDLSIAGAIGLGGIIAAEVIDPGSIADPLTQPGNMTILLAMLAAVGVGILIGLFNGAIVTGFGIHAFVATLGSGAVLAGLALWRTDRNISLRNRFQELANSEWPGFHFLHPRMMVWIMVGVLVVLALMMARTVAGRRLDAIGGNMTAARLSGIRVSRYRILAFVISGGCAAGAGALLAARTGVAATNAGNPFLLEAYTAAFLGAVTLRNGEFHILGTFIGVLFLKVTFSGIALMGWPSFWPDIVTGGILILAVSASGLVTKLLRR
ncbi:ABC transporter permease [Candidatus Poriferisocius sp.]|uniref:ABC transporter permease n=1 Tax=Candidatus Poriferisocius sp. TaxID=3101276 RepID=UPI003B5C07B2